MENLPATQPTANQLSLASRAGWAVLIVATLYVCYFSHLGAIGFVGPDEPRYAWIARDMAETGDWVTPRLYGKPWFEKPPLFYWGAALSFKLFGVSEAAARLPSAMSALLATLVVAWLAWRMYGAETARWLLLLLPTTVGMIGFSHAAATDMPFSGMLTIAMVFAAILLRLLPETQNSLTSVPIASFISSTSFAAVLFGFFLGLAVLAKGPVGLVLCGGAVFFWALLTKRWRDAFRLLHPAGVAAFCGTALPWYILCAHRNPDFFRIFIIEHNFKRYLTPEFQHVQPFWFYLLVLLIGFLPWTAALLWTVVAGGVHLWQKRQPTPASSFLVSWAAFCLLFFSLSQSKLPGYILPALPPIGLVFSASCTTVASKIPRPFGATLLTLGLLFFGFFLALRQSIPNFLTHLGAFVPLGAFVLLLLTLANTLVGCAFLFISNQTWRNLVLVVSLAPIVLALSFSPRILDRTPVFLLSPQYLATEILASGIPINELRVSKVGRSTLYGLNYYLRTDLLEWNRDPTQEVYVLIEAVLPCREQPKEMTCSDLWGYQDRIGTFTVLRLIPKR